MVTWKEFAAAEPDLADVGRSLLYQFKVGLAFLATVRQDGAPRLHPVCPVLSNGRLFVLITPTSPKRYDLLRDGKRSYRFGEVGVMSTKRRYDLLRDGTIFCGTASTLFRPFPSRSPVATSSI